MAFGQISVATGNVLTLQMVTVANAVLAIANGVPWHLAKILMSVAYRLVFAKEDDV